MLVACSELPGIPILAQLSAADHSSSLIVLAPVRGSTLQMTSSTFEMLYLSESLQQMGCLNTQRIYLKPNKCAAPLMPILMVPPEEARAMSELRPAGFLCFRAAVSGAIAAALSILGPEMTLGLIIPGACVQTNSSVDLGHA